MWQHVMWYKFTDISDKHTASIFSDTLKLEGECPSEMSENFTSVDSVTSIIVTTVKTSNLTQWFCFGVCNKFLLFNHSTN
jgi:hypothetical protein